MPLFEVSTPTFLELNHMSKRIPYMDSFDSFTSQRLNFGVELLVRKVHHPKTLCDVTKATYAPPW